MPHVLSAYRPWLAAAILSSTVVLSACGGAEGANSLLDEKRPTFTTTEPAESDTGASTGQGSQRPGGSQSENNEGGHNNPDSGGQPGLPNASTPTDPGADSGSDTPPAGEGQPPVSAPTDPDGDSESGTPPVSEEPPAVSTPTDPDGGSESGTPPVSEEPPAVSTPTDPDGDSESEAPPIAEEPPDASTPTDPDGDSESDNPPADEGPPDDSTEAERSVILMWSPPTERENGEYLEDYELGGYEIRYRQSEQEDYEVVLIEEGLAEEYEFHDLAGTFHFEIAVYDTSGLYSEFVPIRPFD